MSGWRRLWPVLRAVFLIACAVGSYVLAVMAGAAKGWDQILTLGGGAALVIPPIGAQLLQNARQRARLREAKEIAKEYEARFAVALGDVVTPLADLLGRIATDRADAGRLRGQLIQAVVAAAAQLCGPDEGTRAVFFELDGDRLVPKAWQGRGDQPRTTFVDGQDERGTKAHDLVRSHDFVSVDDVHLQDLPEGLRVRPDARYQTFIAVGVFAGGRNFGMLCVDALEAGSIEAGSIEVARALAQLLGAGLA